MLEIVPHPLRGVLQSAQMTDGHLFQMAFGSGRSTAGHGSLEIGIQQFVLIQRWAVRWQLKHFDGLRMLRQPLSDRLGVMHLEIVQDQKHLPAVGVFDQPLQEVEQDARVHRPIEHLPAHRAVIGHNGDHRHGVATLIRWMGITAIYRMPRTSQRLPAHRIYPYLLGQLMITRPNRVWASDITYSTPSQRSPPVWG